MSGRGRTPARRPVRSRPPSTGPAASGYWVTGRRPVEAAVRSGRALRLAVAEGAQGLGELLGAAEAAGTPVRALPRAELDRLAGTPAQGCAAWVRPPRPVPLDTLLSGLRGQPTSLLVVSDHLQDPRNLGAIARTAEAVGASALILPARRAAGVTAAVERSSAGALGALPWTLVHNVTWALDRCREESFWVFGADPAGGLEYTEVDFRGRTALVIGAEGGGLGRLVRRHCDALVRLPLWGSVRSLNASVAAGVLMYEWARATHRPVGSDGVGGGDGRLR